MLQRLTISGYKCLAEVSLPLAALNLLAGTNSSGKSSVIQSILMHTYAVKTDHDQAKWSSMMNVERIRSAVATASAEIQSEALLLMLGAHAVPVFGAAKAVEHEVAAFLALQRLGILTAQPDEYELVMTLRVTKSKARALLYQVALRQSQSPEQTDVALRKLLSQPRVTKEGSIVLIEVPDPLLMDSLRQRVRQLGFISDGSFSGSVAKIPLTALSMLVATLVPAEDQARIKAKLSEQGISDDDLRNMISAAIGQLGKMVAGSTGERVAEQIGAKLSDFLCNSASAAFDWVGSP